MRGHLHAVAFQRFDEMVLEQADQRRAGPVQRVLAQFVNGMCVLSHRVRLRVWACAGNGDNAMARIGNSKRMAFIAPLLRG